MKYAGMPGGMWLLFAGSFRKNLTAVLNYDRETAGLITGKAKKDIERLSESCRNSKKAIGSK